MTDCERKLQLHQAALEAGTDPKIVKQWTDEVLARQASANAQLAAIGDRPRHLTEEEIATHLGDQVDGLGFAVPKRRAEIYRDLGLKLTYKPQERVVRAEMLLNADRMGKLSCPRGDTNQTHMPSSSPGRSCSEAGEWRWQTITTQATRRIGVSTGRRRSVWPCSL